MTRNKEYCDCGSDEFHAIVGIEQQQKDLTDPRRPGYNEVVVAIECTKCGEVYDV